jgi:hypothetical protein
MSYQAANPAASPAVSLGSRRGAIIERRGRAIGVNVRSAVDRLKPVREWASCGIQALPLVRPIERVCGGICRVCIRSQSGHCFRVLPAPCGTASLCFVFIALRVLVPPRRAPPRKRSLALGSRTLRLAPPRCDPDRNGNSNNGDNHVLQPRDSDGLHRFRR